MKIWYLYQSGFALQTSEHFLIFDYWRDRPKGAGLDDGVIDPVALRNDDVVVFVSHRHGDHYCRKIYGWKNDIPRLRIILSDDIRTNEDVLKVAPGSTLKLPDLNVYTLKSNDEGVAFIVDVDGLRIYHAGDLNWWHWEGEPDDYNEGMATSYKSQIDKLSESKVDVAFLPLDPRLEAQYAWGFDYFMRTVNVSHAVPMHFGNDSSVVARLLDDPVSIGYRDRIKAFTEYGKAVPVTLSGFALLHLSLMSFSLEIGG